MTNISLRLHGRYLRFGTLSHAAAPLRKPRGGFTLTLFLARGRVPPVWGTSRRDVDETGVSPVQKKALVLRLFGRPCKNTRTKRIIRTLSQQEKGSDYFCFWEAIMDKTISCEFNIDTACVEVKYADSSMISADYTLVEAEVVRNMYESSELEWLVYNAPVDYMNLLLYRDGR